MFCRRRRTAAALRKKSGRDEQWHWREVERRRLGVSVARSGGGELEMKRRRKKKEWGKKQELPPLPYLYRGAADMGRVVVLHYPDYFCGGSPRGGATRGGGSNNRATRRIMAANVAVINGNDHSTNCHLM
jgi:hypothetical protein